MTPVFAVVLEGASAWAFVVVVGVCAFALGWGARSARVDDARAELGALRRERSAYYARWCQVSEDLERARAAAEYWRAEAGAQ